MTFNIKLPSAEEAEAHAIGCVFLDPTGLADQIEGLQPDHFTVPDHRVIWQAVLDANVPDPVSVWSILSSRGQSVGDGNTQDLEHLEYLASLPIAPSLFPEHVKEIKRAFTKRTIIDKAITLARVAETYGDPDLSKLFEDTEAMAAEVSVLNTQNGNGPAQLSEVQERVIDRAEKIRNGVINPILTGWKDWDALLGGFEEEGVYTVAGRPSMGKTAMVLSLIHTLARQGYRVLLFSAELAAEQIVQRLDQMEMGVGASVFRNPLGSHPDPAAWATFVGNLKNFDLPIAIDDNPTITPPYIRQVVRQFKTANGLDIIVIDRGNTMSWAAYAKLGRTVELQEIGNAIKAFARAIRLPVIETLQISRGPESRKDKRPHLGDLAFAGEQHADVVLLLYNEHYYDKSTPANVIEVNVAKNRLTGQTGEIRMHRNPMTGQIRGF